MRVRELLEAVVHQLLRLHDGDVDPLPVDIEVGMAAPGEGEVALSVGAGEADVTRVHDEVRSERRDDARRRAEARTRTALDPDAYPRPE
jgi:hypothetical protein